MNKKGNYADQYLSNTETNQIEKIPESFLIKTPIIIDKSKNFSYQDELHFLTNEAAIIKIVNLLQSMVCR